MVSNTPQVKKNKRSRIRQFLQNGALVFGSLLFFFFLSEIILRLFGYGNLEIYQPDRNLFWKLLPNQDCYTKFGHKTVHINAKGTRGKDFNEKKPKDVYRIISLGDSKTFGWGLSESETYSGLLENLLQKHVGDQLKIEVINAGVNAWSYAQMYIYLRDIGMKYNPDLVILADANLWTQFSEESSNEFRKKFMRRVWLKSTLRRSAIYHYFIEVKLQNFYERYRARFIPIDSERDPFFKEEQQSNSSLFFEEQIIKICQLLETYLIKGIIICIPQEALLDSSQKDPIFEIKRKISKQFRIPFVDFREYFAAARTKLFLPNDPVHPNAEGNRIIAHRISNFVMKDLAEYWRFEAPQ